MKLVGGTFDALIILEAQNQLVEACGSDPWWKIPMIYFILETCLNCFKNWDVCCLNESYLSFRWGNPVILCDPATNSFHFSFLLFIQADSRILPHAISTILLVSKGNLDFQCIFLKVFLKRACSAIHTSELRLTYIFYFNRVFSRDWFRSLNPSVRTGMPFSLV